MIRDKEGNLFLVNEEDEAYLVEEIIVFVWERCDNKTFEELLTDICTSTSTEPDELRKPLEILISRLKEAKLLA